MPAPPMSKKDGFQVLKSAFDDATGRLRVDAIATIGPGGISAADGDNIAISDGTDTLAINPDGSLNSQVEVSAADGDNIAISDGVDTMAVNADGSINTQSTISGEVSIEISAADGDNIAISDGVDTMSVNADGSINITDNGSSITVDGAVAVNNAAGAAAVNIQDGGNSITVDGTVAATQSGTWNINNVSGTVSLPTGASTLVAQNTGNLSLSSIDGKLNSLGQKTSGASVPVVIASNQSAIPVSSGTPTAGTVTQAAITVGTAAVRTTVTGSTPAATRSLLIINPDFASGAKFYIGSSSVTSTGGTRGAQLIGGDKVAFNNDAGDYYIISDTAGQTVYIIEQA